MEGVLDRDEETETKTEAATLIDRDTDTETETLINREGGSSLSLKIERYRDAGMQRCNDTVTKSFRDEDAEIAGLLDRDQNGRRDRDTERQTKLNRDTDRQRKICRDAEI